MDRELAPLAREMRWQRDRGARRLYRGPGVLAAVVGVGRASHEATHELLSTHRPDEVVLVGIAGALDPAFKVGDALSAHLVEDDDHRFELEPVAGLRGVVLTSVAHLGDRPHEGAQVVDMEAVSVARAATAHSVSLRVIRSISDTPGELPDWIEGLLRADGGTDWGGVGRLVLAHPSRIPTMVAMVRRSTIATKSMVAATADYLRST